MVQAQVSNRTPALLAVECEAARGTCDIQNLVRYRFNKGELVSKETIYTTKDLGVRFDLGENHIYRNRFVITNWGDVIDIENKKLLHEGEGEFVAVEGDQIIHNVRRDGRRGYFVYDLKLNRYGRLRLPSKWTLPGLLSPDQTKSAEGDNRKIWLYRLNGKRKLLGSGFAVNVDISASIVNFRAPVFWLDNHRILTQTGNGKLVVVRLDGSVQRIVDIPVERPGGSLPSFYLSEEGKPVYQCSEGEFIIDVKNRSYAPYDWVGLGHQFDVEAENNPAFGNIIRYRGTEIGRLWSGTSRITDGYLAVEYGEVGSNLGYPKGIKVWSRDTGKWTTIDSKWLSTIIGWVDE
jgi:hypothetical protein